jgi:polysaccharide export outer membrane protein
MESLLRTSFRTNRVSLIQAALLAAMVLVAAGCGGTATSRPNPPQMPDGAATTDPQPLFNPDQLFPGNRITIRYYGPPNPPGPHQEQIRSDGYITPPLLGQEVLAAGKTIAALQQELYALYVPIFFKTITITVHNEERYYFVGGEVKMPGQKPYLSAMTGLQAIQSAGDFTDFANRTKVQIRRSDGKSEVFNAKDAIRDPTKDPAIHPGDVVHVYRGWW